MREQPRLHVVVRAGSAAAAKAALDAVKSQAYPRKRAVLLAAPIEGQLPGWARRLAKDYPGLLALAGGSVSAVLAEIAPRQDDFLMIWPGEDAAHPARLAGIVRRLEAESAAASSLSILDAKTARAALLDFSRAGAVAPDAWVATAAGLSAAESGTPDQAIADVAHLSLRVFAAPAAAKAADLIARHGVPSTGYDERSAQAVEAALALAAAPACEVVASCGRVMFQYSPA